MSTLVIHTSRIAKQKRVIKSYRAKIRCLEIYNSELKKSTEGVPCNENTTTMGGKLETSKELHSADDCPKELHSADDCLKEKSTRILLENIQLYQNFCQPQPQQLKPDDGKNEDSPKQEDVLSEVEI